MRKDEVEQPLVPALSQKPKIEEENVNRPVHEELPNGSKLEHEIQLQEEQQRRLMDSSGWMLDYLRMVVFTLRTQNQELKRDFD